MEERKDALTQYKYTMVKTRGEIVKIILERNIVNRKMESKKAKPQNIFEMELRVNTNE